MEGLERFQQLPPTCAGRMLSELMLSQTIFACARRLVIKPPIAKNIVIWRSAICRQQADHRYRVGDSFRRGCKGLFLGIAVFLFLGRRLQDRLEVDRDGCSPAAIIFS